MRTIVDLVNDHETLLCLRAEREFLRLLQVDCNSPVGVLATIDNGVMKMRAQFFHDESKAPREGEVEGEHGQGEHLADNCWSRFVERTAIMNYPHLSLLRGGEGERGGGGYGVGGEAPGEGISITITSMSTSPSKKGKVYLVGAGPGDLGLVTLRAKECIESADVIVHDHLANPEMLGWARDDAEIIYAGKRRANTPWARTRSTNCSSKKRARKSRLSG